MDKKYFVLFANCIPVGGAKNFIICDLVLNRFKYIPEVLYYILRELKGKSIVEINRYFNNTINDQFEKYIHHLSVEDYGFFTNDKECFPEISLEYCTPVVFNNAILDYDQNSIYCLNNAISKIDIVGCHALQIRYFKPVDLEIVQNTLKKINETAIRYLEIIFGVGVGGTIDEIRQLFKINRRLRKIFLFNQETNEIVDVEDNHSEYGYLILKKHSLVNETACGVIKKDGFVADLNLFSESQKFNNCLNKKISIDKNGEVKNCPSMGFSYGKIEDVDLKKIGASKKFKRYWNINKDKVEVCKDCEFRYICVDCRAYIQSQENIYSKPLKCGYDPYTGTWKARP